MTASSLRSPQAPKNQAKPIEQLIPILDETASFLAALKGRTPVVFLDFDGTLAPIAERPEAVVFSAARREAVRKLAGKLPVAIVSGRDRADVEKQVGLPGLTYAGGHGFDIRLAPSGSASEVAPDDADPLAAELDGGLAGLVERLDAMEAALHAGLDGIAGALIERKRFSVAAHDRMVAPADRPAFAAALEAARRDLRGLREKAGKRLVEFLPDIDWDKGKAVLHLRRALGVDGEGYVAVFFGDDLTDEDAFRVLPEIDGIGVLVAGADEDGRGRTSHAFFRVADPDGVCRLLNDMVA
ncbi:trehalose-phosphatase [Rhodospirillum rubrum]|uniref:Trehalose 6-phosphate phosphatase n=1 Tax=Rhodospirillum rubrum (strain ATCC 11170 / ATH 1.1.1 / DSM 467 / LMG 4362 / NCIMB 8255 / S1) TaxID=269796 RepID=Q2RR96_RHORT|nr:trehalose-phosphatase [Rhodospirillum rubrum]ABC23349.1 HAD-superfamily hydrolase subfamily IIB [Rhodospirillum rubrum ATCC 11170]AEO49082.1 HAD family hydrolase [Rhodospirillum rubrum F11]MBK5954993.1 trehalose-phosphatase [Rhodospirillum rubrum]QXG79322.1 trehalose-phosphatase [Rhodospirillum rubrum]